MTTSDPRDVLARIKAHNEDEPSDITSLPEVLDFWEIARGDVDRLTEALEAVLSLVEANEEAAESMLGRRPDDEEALTMRDGADDIRRTIETELIEEES